MFIYAIFGMSFFMNIKHDKSGIDEVYNFETFEKSMILLFQLSTSAGWNYVLEAIINEKDCLKPDPETGYPGNCGYTAMGIAYILSYLFINFLIVINMYIAVILENYSQATEDVQVEASPSWTLSVSGLTDFLVCCFQEGLTGDDYDMYYEIWQQFDPDGTQYIRYDQLTDLFDLLEPPLQIHKPNKYKIVSMDVPICRGDLMYCVDILDALTRDFFARKGNPVEEPVELDEAAIAPDRPADYDPVSSTLWRQREEYCARLIQNAWRRHRTKKDEPPSPSPSLHRSPESDDDDDDNDDDDDYDDDDDDAADDDDDTSQPHRGPVYDVGSQTSILVDSDGLMTKHGHKVIVVHSRSSSVSSRSTDV